jgi:hypothetical protein
LGWVLKLLGFARELEPLARSLSDRAMHSLLHTAAKVPQRRHALNQRFPQAHSVRQAHYRPGKCSRRGDRGPIISWHGQPAAVEWRGSGAHPNMPGALVPSPPIALPSPSRRSQLVNHRSTDPRSTDPRSTDPRSTDPRSDPLYLPDPLALPRYLHCRREQPWSQAPTMQLVSDRRAARTPRSYPCDVP